MKNFIKKIIIAAFAIPLALCLSAGFISYFLGLNRAAEIVENTNFTPQESNEVIADLPVEDGIPPSKVTLTKINYEPQQHQKRKMVHISALGAEIVKARQEGVSAQEIAKSADLALTELEGIEQGLSIPTKEVAEAIARQLHIDLYYKKMQ